ncbi:MAG: hypothetical protein DA405_09770 [Bacteroidetes bacterium]|nr:MAG: hypothetical protein DA405_09770 [Bacteroidota bacterium]
MAKHWEKLSDKLGSSAEGPSAADWAAMEQMIANTPGLQAKPFFTTSVKIAILSFALVISSAALWWITKPSLETIDQNQEIQEKMSSSPQITAPIPAAKEINSESNLPLNSTENISKHNIEKATNNDLAPKGRENSTLVKPSSESKTNVSNNSAVQAVQAIANVTKNASAEEQKNNKVEALENRTETNSANSNLAAKESSVSKSSAVQTEEKSTEPIVIHPENSSSEIPFANSIALGSNVDVNNSTTAKDLPSDSLSSKENSLFSEANASYDSSAQNISNSGEAAALAATANAPSSDDDFINAATGFKLQAVNFALGGASNFANPPGFGFQAAVDFQWNRNNWFFQGGLSISQDYRQYEYNVLENNTLIDSTWSLTTSNRQVASVSAIWVIDSINAGHYEYDTTFQTVIDTSIVLNIDSNDYQISYPKSQQIRFQYAELPLLYGYQSQFGSWTLSLAAGLSVQQALAINDENYVRAEAFSLAFLVQPAISYKISQQWSVFSRLRLQEQLLENRLFQTNQSPYSCQLGVSYHW